MPAAAVRKRVAAAQHLLANLGYRPGKADGQYGRRTRDAVKRFQRDHRIARTGEITPRLITVLKRARKKAQAARRATRRSVAATGSTPRLKQPRTASGADSAAEEDGMWNRTKGWFGKATSSVGGLFDSDDDTQSARSESKVGGFFKSQQEQHETLRRQCEDNGESWVKDQSSGAWIDCSQYR